MASDRSIRIMLMLESAQFVKGMNRAADATREIGDSGKKTNGNIELLKSGMTKVGAAAAAGIAVAIKSYADFDQAMSSVKANVNTNAAGMEQLKQAAIDAGASTVYNATESANAIVELAKAGLSTKDILAGGLTGALNLAASDGMQVADAAELMSSTLAQFNLTGSDAGRVADALASGAAAAQGSAHDLGMGLSQCGMVANSFGLSMEETVGTLSAFANKGMMSSDAGTSLKSMLLALAKPSTAAANEMDALGINVYDAQGNFIGLAGVAGELKSKMSGLTEEERNAAMATIFGSDATRAANILYDNGASGIKKWAKTVSQSGFAAQQAATMTDNLKGDMEQLSGSIETVAINLGSQFNGPARGVVQTLDALVNLFGSIPAPVQAVLLSVTAAAGGLTGLHKVMAPLTTSTDGWKKSLGAVLDPVSRVQAAWPQLKTGFEQIGLAAQGAEPGVELLKNGMTRSQAASAGLKNVIGGLVTAINPWTVAIGLGMAALTRYANHVEEVKQKTEQLQSTLQSGGKARDQVISDFQGMSDGVLGFRRNLTDSLKNAGISLSDMADAAMGDEAAIKRVNKAIAEYANQGHIQASEAGSIKSALQSESKAYKDASDATLDAAAAKKSGKGATKDASGATEENTAALADNAAQEQDTADASDILANSFGATTKGISDQAAKLGECVKAMDDYYGFAMDAADADIDWQDKLQSANDAIQKNGQNLDITTEAGRSNKSALDGVAKSAWKLVEAHARAGASADDLKGEFDNARNSFVDFAQRMGATPEQATQMADAFGLTHDGLQKIIADTDRLDTKKATVAITVNDTASATLEKVGATATSMPDGTVTIDGSDEKFMQKVSEVTGVKIDPKTGDLTLNADQYNVALALANGATIDPKTGYLKGENSDAWQKFCAVQGWKIDPKTGIIKANDQPFQATKGWIAQTKVPDKSVTVKADPGPFNAWKNSAIGKFIGDVFVRVRGGKADGGMIGFAHGGAIRHMAGGGYNGPIHGPGTSTSDSVPIMASTGEFMQRAAAVSKYGYAVMDDINNLRLPTDLFSAYYSGAYDRSYANTSTYSAPAQTASSAPTLTREDLVSAFADAMQTIPGWTLQLDNSVLAGQIAPQMNRALGRLQQRGNI